MLEEERRLCYVGMTRAEKRLILTWARYRAGASAEVQQERSIPSAVFGRGPGELIVNLGADDHVGASQIDLTSERYEVRERAAPAQGVYGQDV